MKWFLRPIDNSFVTKEGYLLYLLECIRLWKQLNAFDEVERIKKKYKDLLEMM